MGLELLPWERWFPPHIYGPLILAAPLLLAFSGEGRWWHYVLPMIGAVFGA